MDFPPELKYTKDHEWLRLDADSNTAEVGITSFAQSELGDVVFVELQPVGTDISAESVFGTVEAVKTVSDLFAPVDGKILEVNEALDSQPELVNQDPYGAGWMIRIEVASADAVNGLLTADEYADMVAA